MAKFHENIFPKQPDPNKVAIDPMKNAVKSVDAGAGGYATKTANGPDTTPKGVDLKKFYKGPKK